MQIEVAENLVSAYRQVLQGTSLHKTRWPSLLPCSKERLMVAGKIVLARLYQSGDESRDAVDELLRAMTELDTFTTSQLPAEETDRVRRRRQEEFADYCEDLHAIPRNGDFYWQRVYALIGVTGEFKSTTFFEYLQQRLSKWKNRTK